MKKKPETLLVLTTVPSRRVAVSLVEAALEARAAACVSVSGPVRSHYVWKGVREQAVEYRVTFKLPARGYARLEALVREHHPYECPEIVALAVVTGAAPYLAWLEDQVSRPEQARVRRRLSTRRRAH